MLLGAFALGDCLQADATSGDLDPAFGNGGIATVDFAGGDIATALVRDAAGYLYIGGYTGSPVINVVVAKLDPTGQLVAAFGTGGKAIVDIGSGSAGLGGAIAINGAGDVYVAGSIDTISNSDFAVIKLDASGHIDSGFGVGGKVVIDIDGNDGLDYASAVAVDAGGNIVVAGTTVPASDTSNPQIALVKLDATGQRFAAFGTNGVQTLRVDGRANRSGSIVMDPAGSFLIGGGTYSAGGTGTADIFIAKFDANGQAIPGFGAGVVALIHESYPTVGVALVRGADGMLYTSGGAQVEGHAYFYVAKLTPNGQLVTTFGAAGSQLVDPADGAYDGYARAAVDAAGHVFLAGATDYPGTAKRDSAPHTIEGGFAHIVVAQVDATGTPVDSFGIAGVTSVPIADRNSYSNAVLLDGNDHLYLGGYVVYDTPVAGNYADDLVIRLLLERPDALFANGFDVPE
jgi:uncharacterized delta-60 repeat protein